MRRTPPADNEAKRSRRVPWWRRCRCCGDDFLLEHAWTGFPWPERHEDVRLLEVLAGRTRDSRGILWKPAPERPAAWPPSADVSPWARRSTGRPGTVQDLQRSTELLSEMDEALAKSVAGRSDLVEVSMVQEWTRDGGPFTAEEALDLRLVDA